LMKPDTRSNSCRR